MCVGENTSRLANVRAKRVRCGEPQPFQTRAQRSGYRLRSESENVLEEQQYHNARNAKNTGDDRVEPAHLERYADIRAEEVHEKQHHKSADGVQQQLERQLDGRFEQLDEKAEKMTATTMTTIVEAVDMEDSPFLYVGDVGEKWME